MVRRCVRSRNFVNEGTMAHWGAVALKGEKVTRIRVIKVKCEKCILKKYTLNPVFCTILLTEARFKKTSLLPHSREKHIRPTPPFVTTKKS